MRTSSLLASMLLFAAVFAGCLAAEPGAELEPSTDSPSAPVPSHVLVNATEPTDLVAPTFKRLGALASAGPVYGGGEPSISAALDGTLYVSFPGCDTGPYLVNAPVAATCEHGIVYKSVDEGATWTRLNDAGNGRLPGAGDAPAANNDADIAVDAAGHVYTSNLGAGGIQVFRSEDGGASWAYAGDVVPEEHSADRQWMAAAGPGHVIMTWMGFSDADPRAVAIATTWDGGRTWSNVTYVGKDIGWLGTVQFDPSGKNAYIPFTEGGFDLAGTESREFSMLVARTLDGGESWEVVDTGARIMTSGTGGHWSGVLMAPALDVTGDGTIVTLWAEDVRDPTGSTSTGTLIKYVTSTDNGTSWSAPVTVPTRMSAVMPWVTGGAGDRFAITYFESDAPLDTDYVGGVWDVAAIIVDGAASARPVFAHSLIDERVHVGGICARGGLCLLTGSDRALLDFFESDLLPDGRLVVVYPADPPEGGKFIEIRTAIQDGGSFLLAR